MRGGLVAAARGREAPLVVSRYGDVTAPPLLFRRALFGELLAWTGEGGGKAVVQAHKHEAMYVDRPVTLLTDVDTPEDFAAAIAAGRPVGQGKVCGLCSFMPAPVRGGRGSRL